MGKPSARDGGAQKRGCAKCSMAMQSSQPHQVLEACCCSAHLMMQWRMRVAHPAMRATTLPCMLCVSGKGGSNAPVAAMEQNCVRCVCMGVETENGRVQIKRRACGRQRQSPNVVGRCHTQTKTGTLSQFKVSTVWRRRSHIMRTSRTIKSWNGWTARLGETTLSLGTTGRSLPAIFVALPASVHMQSRAQEQRLMR